MHPHITEKTLKKIKNNTLPTPETNNLDCGDSNVINEANKYRTEKLPLTSYEFAGRVVLNSQNRLQRFLNSISWPRHGKEQNVLHKADNAVRIDFNKCN